MDTVRITKDSSGKIHIFCPVDNYDYVLPTSIVSIINGVITKGFHYNLFTLSYPKHNKCNNPLKSIKISINFNDGKPVISLYGYMVVGSWQ